MDVTKDIRPLTEFKRDTTRVLAHLKESRRPTVLTVNGKPELVVMDAQAWQDMQDRIDREAAIAGIAQGLDGARAGRVTDAKQVFDRLASETR